MTTITERLGAMGITLPTPAAPAAAYIPFVQHGNLIFTSGQLPLRDGALVATGKLGAGIDLATGQDAARWCAINILAQAQVALGDIEKIKRIVKLTCFVASDPSFTEQHLVANGASQFLGDILDRGGHARSAVGVPCLPLDAPVEIEAIIEV